MQAIYIILFISAVALSSMSLTIREGVVDPGDATQNFLTYRDAVLQYKKNNPLASGTIQWTSLALPSTWHSAPSWSNQIVGNDVYVWGQLSAEGKRELEKTTFCSQAYFYSEENTKTRSICAGTAGPVLPVSLPNKTVVSVIEVN